MYLTVPESSRLEGEMEQLACVFDKHVPLDALVAAEVAGCSVDLQQHEEEPGWLYRNKVAPLCPPIILASGCITVE